MTQQMMKAARIHELHKPLSIDEVAVPEIGGGDVLIRVEAVHVAQYHKSALIDGEHSYNFYPPKFPSIVGMGGAGVVEKVGADVFRLEKGERVYVNPILSCGNCEHCISNKPGLCDMWVLQGYYALFTDKGLPLLENYPGGFATYMKAPIRSVVRIPDNVPFEHAARFNYTGVPYQGLKKGNMAPGKTVIINGSTGSLGYDGTICALAMGATKVLAIGRNRERLSKVKNINPNRVVTIVSGEENITERILEETDGKGAHLYLDCLGYTAGKAAPIDSVHQCLYGLRKGGSAVFLGALMGQDVSYDYGSYVGASINVTGSVWYNNESVLEIADLVSAGLIDYNNYEEKIFHLDEVNDALDFAGVRSGAYYNVIVKPNK